MNPIDAVVIAFTAIAANRLRSALTALGLIIGVSSVIVLIAVGQGAQEGVTSRIRGLGTNLIFITPGAAQNVAQTQGARTQAETLTLEDSTAIESAGISGIVGVDAQVSVPAQAIAGSQNAAVTVIGTTANYADVRGVSVDSGAFISDSEVASKSLTVALGSAVAEQLYGETSPIGQFLRVSFGGGRVSFQYRIVGVMATRGAASGGQEDSYVYVPVTSVESRIGSVRTATGQVQVRQIDVKTAPGANQDLVKSQITTLLLQRHAVTTADFQVQSQDDLIGTASQVSTTLSILLGSIAGISLVVGAIGVMNIMLVSVTERTREIGIRRAVGARAGDIVEQFVTEALMLCLAGGAVGVAAGVAAAELLDGRSIAGSSMTTVVQPWSIIAAFVVAAGVGLLSGSYPAYRATGIDPISALRSE